VTRTGARSAVLCEACKRAGVPTIAVLSGGVLRGELETAGAQAVFDNPHDL
jgi:phosphoglycolate phosphatase-like HAD superfamily hydrolase